MKNAQKQKGFSLLEVMVAFIIACTCLGFLYNIHANTTQAIRLSEEYAIASDLAQSLIAESSTLSSIPSISNTGELNNKFFWEVNYSNINEFDQDESNNPLHLIQIAISIHWQSKGKTRELQTTSLKPLYTNQGVDL